MAITINVNGVAISYPQTGDPEWGDDATEFAIQVAGALAKIGQSTSPATNNITIPSGNLTVTTGNTDLGGTLDVTGATTLDSTLTVAGTTTLNGTANLNGNTNLGNANTDTIAVTGILNVDSGTLYVNPTDNRVGINDSSPSEALDVTGNVAVSGSITGASATLTNLIVDTNLIITNSTDNRVGINTTTPQEALDVTGEILVSSDITVGGVIVADDSTNVTTAPPITFTGDTNTGIGHSSADTLDFVTNAVSRARISSTGLQSSVIPDLSGSNTNLYNEYKCRAWVNFNGTGAIAQAQTIRGNGNVSSVTKNFSGDYTVNFATAMPDADYCLVQSSSTQDSTTVLWGISPREDVANYSAGSIRFSCKAGSTGTNQNATFISIGIFR